MIVWWLGSGHKGQTRSKQTFFECVDMLLGVWDVKSWFLLITMVQHVPLLVCVGCGGVLCENCIVDASNLYSFCLFLVFLCVCCCFLGHTVDAWAH